LNGPSLVTGPASTGAGRTDSIRAADDDCALLHAGDRPEVLAECRRHAGGPWQTRALGIVRQGERADEFIPDVGSGGDIRRAAQSFNRRGAPARFHARPRSLRLGQQRASQLFQCHAACLRQHRDDRARLIASRTVSDATAGLRRAQSQSFSTILTGLA
jgi:hypothetical protein